MNIYDGKGLNKRAMQDLIMLTLYITCLTGKYHDLSNK